MKIRRDSEGGYGILVRGRAEYVWRVLRIVRAKPGCRRWGWLTPWFGSGEQKTRTLTVAGWNVQYTRQTDRAGEHIARISDGLR
jgi:hypothetical protein